MTNANEYQPSPLTRACTCKVVTYGDGSVMYRVYCDSDIHEIDVTDENEQRAFAAMGR